MAEQKKFAYTARNSSGDIASGVITADSETAAARRLQLMGMAPLSLRRSEKAPAESMLATNIKLQPRVKAKHLAMFARQFATMVDAGLPLVRAITALAEQSDHATIKETLPKVRADLEAGSSFSGALAKHPKVFPNLLTGLVAAGEISGDLSSAMNRIADSYEKDARLRSKVVSAMTYPVVVLNLAIIIVIFMMIFIVPQFKKIFAGLGGDLPLPTQILINISNSMVIVLPILIVLAVTGVVLYRRNKQARKLREIIDPIKLKFPILGKFMQKIAVARFARTLSSLLASGVPMLQALEIVSTTAGNIIISDAIDEVRSAVRSGKPINTTLAEHPVFPPLVIQMISTGEETGALPEMLIKIAEYYEREVETTSESLSSLIEPLLLLFLAVIVGGIVISLYLPIFTVFSLVNK